MTLRPAREARTADELARALRKVGPTYRPLVAFMAETGARVSEAVAVRFGDVDLQAATRTVAGQLDDEAQVRAAKTPGSIATVPLSQAAVDLVRAERRRLMRRGFDAVAPDAFVFTGRKGQPLQRRNALRAWQEATTKVLGERLRLHDLRTTLASRLAANGVDVATAQGLLRHARPSTTLDVYTRIQGDAAPQSTPKRSGEDSASLRPHDARPVSQALSRARAGSPCGVSCERSPRPTQDSALAPVVLLSGA